MRRAFFGSALVTALLLITGNCLAKDVFADLDSDEKMEKAADQAAAPKERPCVYPDGKTVAPAWFCNAPTDGGQAAVGVYMTASIDMQGMFQFARDEAAAQARVTLANRLLDASAKALADYLKQHRIGSEASRNQVLKVFVDKYRTVQAGTTKTQLRVQHSKIANAEKMPGGLAAQVVISAQHWQWNMVDLYEASAKANPKEWQSLCAGASMYNLASAISTGATLTKAENPATAECAK